MLIHTLPLGSAGSSLFHLAAEIRRFRIVSQHHASNQHQLSLIHPQLKTGSANQRHPFSPRSDSSQPTNQKWK